MTHLRRFHGAAATLLAVTLLGAGSFYVRGTLADTTYGATIPAAAHGLAHPGHGTQTAVLAGGCFWGMQEVFEHVRGVTGVVAGYAGGTKAHANYADSSSGQFGDAEAVRISYDPARISYAELLQIFFSVAHDPTQVDRQGPDVGPQYRSEVFAANADQATAARDYIRQLDRAGVFDKPIATQVSVGESFYPAETYHQNYAQKHPDSLYLLINDAPKVAALKKRFSDRYRQQTSERTDN